MFPLCATKCGTRPWGASMNARLKLVDQISHQRFEFDYNRNAVFFRSKVIHLSPHEADILHLLLLNRSRVTPLSTLIERVYGMTEPETAPVSIRVAVHSLRKKLAETGIKIRAEARVGYEIDVECVPEMTLGLKDKILSALNVAKASGEREIAERLQATLKLVEAEAFSAAPPAA
jgi:DNA-binding winged helix-turn-helix (wHTH) protein